MTSAILSYSAVVNALLHLASGMALSVHDFDLMGPTKGTWQPWESPGPRFEKHWNSQILFWITVEDQVINKYAVYRCSAMEQGPGGGRVLSGGPARSCCGQCGRGRPRPQGVQGEAWSEWRRPGGCAGCVPPVQHHWGMPVERLGGMSPGPKGRRCGVRRA